MKIEGSHLFKAPRDQVWNHLTDPNIIARCLPGCEKLEPKGNDTYEAVLKIGIGAIKGTFTSQIRIEDQQLPSQYRLSVEGKGAPGFLKGAGVIRLEENGNDTMVNYSGDVQIGGLIASVGQRLVQGFAKQTTAQFFAAMEKQLDT